VTAQFGIEAGDPLDGGVDGRRQDPRPNRGELNGKRQTVQPTAQVYDRRLVRRSQLELARCRRRPLREQMTASFCGN
jgi:hypothetical protein